MIRKPIPIDELVAKFQRGDITSEELAQLIEWYNSHSDDQVIIPVDNLHSVSEVKQRMLDGLMSRVKAEQPFPKASVSWIRTWAWTVSAAAILIVVGLVWFGVRYQRVATTNITAQAHTDSIVPGGNKAILMLADGTQIILDTQQEGIVVGAGIRYADGGLLDKDVDLHEVKDLQLYVPKGGTYQITLGDGTQVWLNSDSRLKYPSRFSETERIVELEGEAFFAVSPLRTKDNQSVPFLVKSKGQSVEVIGTQFNVNAYAEQSYMKTTLLEGKVNVIVANKKVSLKPGQQARTDDKGVKVEQVNPQYFIAWKEGVFSFDGKSFAETMEEIGRWYNLSIEYRSKVPDVELIGDAYRNQNINLVLQLLDAAAIRYRLDIDRRTLIIY